MQSLAPAQQGRSCGGCSSSGRPTFAASRPVAQRRRNHHTRCSSSSGDGAAPSSSPAPMDDGSVSSGSKFLRHNKDAPIPRGEDGAPQGNDLPEHLRDMRLGDDGRLVDGRTGQVINGLGASRFDVAVSALRGDLDPKPWEQNTEHAPGVLAQACGVTWPSDYTFTVVGPGNDDAFLEDVLSLIARVAEAPEAPKVGGDRVKLTPRLGGKFVSVAATCSVRAPEVVVKIAQELRKDARVKMAF